jgi:hypothetical protein
MVAVNDKATLAASMGTCTANVFGTLLPHLEHIMDVYAGSTSTSLFALYSNICLKVRQPLSRIWRASRRFFTMFNVRKRSKNMMSYFLAYSVESLCRKS